MLFYIQEAATALWPQGAQRHLLGTQLVDAAVALSACVMFDMTLVACARNEGWGSLVQRVGHERPFFAVKHVHLYIRTCCHQYGRSYSF